MSETTKITVVFEMNNFSHVDNRPISREEHAKDILELLSDGPDYWMLPFAYDITIIDETEPPKSEPQWKVGDTVRITGGHVRYRISGFNTKDFPEAHASLRAGCTGCWCPVSKLRRWEK